MVEDCNQGKDDCGDVQESYLSTHESENTPCLSTLDAQIIYCIHAQTHFSTFTLFPHTFRIMF